MNFKKPLLVAAFSICSHLKHYSIKQLLSIFEKTFGSKNKPHLVPPLY